MFGYSEEKREGAEVVTQDLWRTIACAASDYGMYYTPIAQLPTELPPYLIKECGIFLTYALSEYDDRTLVAECMGYDPKHSKHEDTDTKLCNFIPSQEIGMALLKFTKNLNSLNIQPILVKTDVLELKRLDIMKFTKTDSRIR